MFKIVTPGANELTKRSRNGMSDKLFKETLEYIVSVV